MDPPHDSPHGSAPPPAGRGPMARTRRWLRAHHGKLFWLHSTYALSLGVWVSVSAAKGLSYARYLVLLLLGAWLLVFVIFRFFGAGREQRLESTGRKLSFLVLNYVLRNAYQAVLFFLLPFYWKSTVLDGPTLGFSVILTVWAVLATLDVVFDKVLMRWRTVGALFYALILFGAVNLAVPVLWPAGGVLTGQLIAGGLTVLGFWTMHVPFRLLKRARFAALLVALIGGGVALSYGVRRSIPPVPMYALDAEVGPRMLAGEPPAVAVDVRRIHLSEVPDLYGVSRVFSLGARPHDLRLAWYHEGVLVAGVDGVSTTVTPSGHNEVRLVSHLPDSALPDVPVGRWHLDVETTDGELVGRTRFEIFE